MTDWREAGHKADAKRVQNLYRKAFATPGQRLAKQRAVDALVAAGCKVVLDFWGGGQTTRALMAAGLRVIAVENGAMRLKDSEGRLVSAKRKHAAHAQDGIDGGFPTFWGDFEDAVRAYPEADGAFLDFHGPWSEAARSCVMAARNMKAVVITLMPDHDMRTGATTNHERRLAYQLYLRMARTGMTKPTWDAIARCGGARVLIDYENASGKYICVYLLSRGAVHLPPVNISDRSKMLVRVLDKKRAKARAYYDRLSDDGKRLHNAASRHNDHLRTGQLPSRPCPMCMAVREPLPCRICGAPVDGHGATRFCSDACRHRKRMADQRRRREAAVSGTAAEAVSSEEAA